MQVYVKLYAYLYILCKTQVNIIQLKSVNKVSK